MLKKAVDWSDIKHISIYEQLNLWYELVGTRNLYQPILSPFRADTNIGGNVYLDHYKGKIVLADFSCIGTRLHNLDIFNGLMMYHNWTFGQMCDYIKSKKQLSFQPKIVDAVDKKCYVNYQKIDGFYKPTLDYFATYDITQQDLIRDGHINCEKLFVNRYDKINKQRAVENWVMKPCHVLYRFPSGNVKLYQPLEENSKARWALSNTNKDDYFITKGDKSSLFIGTSYKDIKCGLKALSLTGSGLAFQNESVDLKSIKEVVWQWIYSHELIIICGDNDNAGKAYQEKLFGEISKNHSNCKEFIFPENLPEKNQFGKKNKDIAEIYRLDKTLIKL